ncbi:uncharacterized protein N7483_010345 [Penicillium malachiteum]|uniref:uncharacterized protein n=1 Tax=Penicillium malachiteum TaxID=1324776 RepID=UPI002547F90C|nr:uncharacterized protein N7483_010345 [Penicillium malachiteum]KAJ5713164.1 hypothetical protein N7483_010345 [Penicillium malachiteum]
MDVTKRDSDDSTDSADDDTTTVTISESTKAYFAQILDDVLTINTGALDSIDGTTAYGFEKVVELAEEGNSEDDAAKLRSLKNAGKILHCEYSWN